MVISISHNNLILWKISKNYEELQIFKRKASQFKLCIQILKFSNAEIINQPQYGLILNDWRQYSSVMIKILKIY